MPKETMFEAQCPKHNTRNGVHHSVESRRKWRRTSGRTMLTSQMIIARIPSSKVSLQELSDDKFASYDLYGKLLNSAGDMDKNVVKRTGDIKKLTSGMDTIRAQQKGEKAFNFKPISKHVFSTNILPRMSDQTSGFFRRLEVIFVIRLVKEMKEAGIILPTAEECTTEEEMSGLFNWVIPKLQVLLSRGKFIHETSPADVQEMYNAASDPITYFVMDMLEEKAGSYISKKDVYRTFKRYCNAKSVYDDVNEVWFWRKMRELIDVWTEPRKVGHEWTLCLLNYDLKPLDENCK